VARLPHVEPEQILNPVRLEQAYKLLDGWTKLPREKNPIPGGAILVARHGQAIEPRFFGRMGTDPSSPAIRKDALFLMASITKPIVYMGAMKLVEQGLLNLTDHVTRYIPEFAAHHKEETLVLHLFTHTSGLPDMLPNNVELRKQHAPLSKFVEATIRDVVPLFPPGTNLSYQSMGTLMVAELIQRLTGQTISDYLQKEIFDPLELSSTSLGLRSLDPKRVVRLTTPDYLQGAQGDSDKGTDYDWNSDYWQKLGAPWGGLLSTPDDFAVICQLMLNMGIYGKVRLLSPWTVSQMTTNRLNDQPGLPEPVRRAEPWGLGWRLNHPGIPESWGDLLSPRTYGHTGASGTTVWIDPDRDGFCVLLTSGLRAAAPWRLVQLSNIIASAFE
jgi:CubicO group peptidase (beta-lactamase class C family)